MNKPSEMAGVWDQLRPQLPTDQHTLLLRACLHDAPGAGEAWIRWRDEAARTRTPIRKALSPFRTFLPLLWWNLTRTAVQIDSDLRTFLRSAHVTEEIRWLKYHAIVRSAFDALSSSRIPYIAVKGAALGELVYPAPLLRHAADIDVLLHRTDLPRAAAVFGALGWRSAEEPVIPNPKHIPPIIHPSGVAIELHHRLLTRYYTVQYDHLWVRSRPAALAGSEARVLSPADNLLHACAHGMTEGGSPRWVADAWFLIERSPDLDWRTLVSATQSARLGLPVYAAVQYLAREMGLPIPDDVTDDLQAIAARTGFLGRRMASLGVPEWTAGTPRTILARPVGALRRLRLLLRRACPPLVEFALVSGVQPWAVPFYYLRRLTRLAGRFGRSVPGFRRWRPGPR